jgi:hypothetical protein
MTARLTASAEYRRLQDPDRWQRWGTYLSDRASHETGWTALVALLLERRGAAREAEA